uniref:Uncharacterized protein n=1 Tax=Marseillevirus LCMAC201 TaxID=2506605 RepID=A0A481YYC3_9VIRU|nr:MAG: hypothetical protein LCMAC201_03760 [Marseillevirus LCMAC201]
MSDEILVIVAKFISNPRTFGSKDIEYGFQMVTYRKMHILRMVKFVTTIVDGTEKED